MMKIGEAPKYVGKKIEIKGWVYRERKLKDNSFIVIRDNTGYIQVVVPSLLAKEVTIESCVSIKGILKEDKRAPTGYEIKADTLEIVGKAERFPITKDQSTEFLLDVRHLWIRSKRLTEMWKIKNTVMWVAEEWLQKEGFYKVTNPIVTANACEGGSTLFEMDYFGKKAYLAQSGQLYSEAFMPSLERVYVLAPSFRAEKSRTRRHLAEYWHLEPEAAWVDHKENMKIQEDFISYVVQKTLEKHEDQLKEWRDISVLKKIKPPFKRVSYDKVIEELKKKDMDIEFGDDLGADEEREFTKDLKKPVFVESFPRGMKAFYMKVDTKNNKRVLAADLLAPEGFGEIIGGSQREENLKELEQNMKMFGLKGKAKADLQWYLDLRRFGTVPHSGFGLGIERLMMWITKADHIRDTIPFPRVINRFKP